MEETEKEILQSIVGKQVIRVDYTGEYSAPITLYFDNGTAITIDAEGDDMTHTVITKLEL